MQKEPIRVLDVTPGDKPRVRILDQNTGKELIYVLLKSGGAESTYFSRRPDGRITEGRRTVPSTSPRARLLHQKVKEFTASAT